MSENTGPMTFAVAPDQGRARSGRPCPGCEVRLADDGEVLCRGGNVFAGYLDDPDKTAETVIDGWLHSGDIGELDDDGYLRIVDRKKELIITAGGKNVSPANLEAALKTIPLVGQAMAVGDDRPFVAALVVLDPEVAPGVGPQPRDRRPTRWPSWPSDPAVVAEIEAGLADGHGRVQPRRAGQEGHACSARSGCPTPTCSRRRRSSSAGACRPATTTRSRRSTADGGRTPGSGPSASCSGSVGLVEVSSVLTRSDPGGRVVVVGDGAEVRGIVVDVDDDGAARPRKVAGMPFSYPRPHAEVSVPDGSDLDEALARTTDLGIVAHQDDLEFMALVGHRRLPRRSRSVVHRRRLHRRGGQRPVGSLRRLHRRRDGRDPRRAEQRAAAEIGRLQRHLPARPPERGASAATATPRWSASWPRSSPRAVRSTSTRTTWPTSTPPTWPRARPRSRRCAACRPISDPGRWSASRGGAASTGWATTRRCCST